MKEIKIYLKEDRKERDFEEGVKLLSKYHKTVKKVKLTFLEKEAAKDEPSSIAIGMLETQLLGAIRVHGKHVDFSNDESEDTDTSNDESEDTDTSKRKKKGGAIKTPKKK